MFLVFSSSQYSYSQETVDDSQLSSDETASRQLIVRFKAEEYTPEWIALELKKDPSSIEEKFGLVESASYLVSERKKIGVIDVMQGKSLEEILQQPFVEPDLSLVHPESIEAHLQSYIVLTYPSRKELEEAKSLLTESPYVESFAENVLGDFLATPNDPYFLNLNSYQWGMFDLNLPDAWDIIKGHAYIGVPDGGLDFQFSEQANYRAQFSQVVYPVGAAMDAFDGVLNRAKGHGTHVAGIIAAKTDNNSGVAGVCWDCSIAFLKTNTASSNLTNAFNILAGIGVQAVNASWVAGGFLWNGNECSNPRQDAVTFCMALALVTERDIIVSAASGNGDKPSKLNPTQGGPTYSDGYSNVIDFPASDPRVIAVGAIDYFGNRAPFSNYGSKLDLMAPGTEIHSTASSYYFPGLCQDDVGPPTTSDGLGNCTGTSMAAPHVTGILGLMRSMDPLLRLNDIKDALFDAAPNPIKVSGEGYGLPDAEKAVNNVAGVVAGSNIGNRLTPLFSLYSAVGTDSFYTTVPQMAYAAIKGTMRPQPPGQTVTYLPAYGASIPGYREFPQGVIGPFPTPVAEVYIFTTSNNPIVPSQPLVPLYRLSFQGTEGGNTNNLDHVYTTDQAGINYYSFAYKLDGIEGYIFDDAYAQPPGTEKLYRYYNASGDDHAIFPESKLSAMISAGYSPPGGGANPWIGFVYPNVDRDNDDLLDGFELAISTCINDSDTDNDGIRDGKEVLQYPRTDPKDVNLACGDSVEPENPLKNNAIGTLVTELPMNYALGYHFTPQVNGTIDRLGGRFNASSRVVKLFRTSDGAQLAQATVSSNNSWNYSSITPVSVSAGVQYTVAVYMNGGNAGWRIIDHNLFPKVFDRIRIDGATTADTSSNSSAIPTNIYLNTTIGEPDIRFTPTAIPPGC